MATMFSKDSRIEKFNEYDVNSSFFGLNSSYKPIVEDIHDIKDQVQEIANEVNAAHDHIENVDIPEINTIKGEIEKLNEDSQQIKQEIDKIAADANAAISTVEDLTNQAEQAAQDAINAGVDVENNKELSKQWAVGITVDPSIDTPTDTNNSRYYAKDAERLHDEILPKVDEAIKASETAVNASQTAVEASTNAKEWTVGLNPTPPFDKPSDTNNVYYYYQQVLGLTSGAISFGGTFTPKAGAEYPAKTGTSTIWLLATENGNSYTFTGGDMAGVEAYLGDWLLYFKTKDVFEVLKVSPLRENNVVSATESVQGIAKIATSSEATAGTDDSTIMTPKKTVEACIKRSGDTMDGALAVKGAGNIISLLYPDSSHGYIKGYRGNLDDFFIGRASDGAPGVSWSNYNGGSAIHIQDSGEIQYNSTGGGEHVFNSIVNGSHFITHKATYPSVRVSGNTGSYGMMELDSVGKNLNLISRNDDGSNRNVWYFKDDGYVKSNKGFETDQYTEGNAYVDQAAYGAPFYVGTLTNKSSNSAYFPAIKWKSKPSAGAWLTSSVGHILSSAGIDATILTSVDEGGKDLKVWEFKRATGDFVSPGNVVAYSDERVKKDIKPIENALDKVKAINGVSYTRTDTGAKQIGVIAQEVEKVLPEIVTTSNNEALGIEDFKGVAYGNMTALLIEAVKDLNNKVEELTERLRAFEED